MNLDTNAWKTCACEIAQNVDALARQQLAEAKAKKCFQDKHFVGAQALVEVGMRQNPHTACASQAQSRSGGRRRRKRRRKSRRKRRRKSRHKRRKSRRRRKTRKRRR